MGRASYQNIGNIRIGASTKKPVKKIKARRLKKSPPSLSDSVLVVKIPKPLRPVLKIKS